MLYFSEPYKYALIFMTAASLAACQQGVSWEDALAHAEDFKSKNQIPAAKKYYSLAIKEMDLKHADQKKELLAINSLVEILLKEKQISEADKYAQKALSLAERIYGPDQTEVLSQIVLLRTVAAEIPDKPRMAKYLDRMIELQEKITGADSAPVMWLLGERVRKVSTACGEKYELEMLRKLVRLKEKYLGVSSSTLRDKLILADCLANNSASAEASKIYDSCLADARLKMPGLLPEVQLRYARSLLSYNKKAKAIELLNEAFSLAGPSGSYNPLLAPEIATELGGALEADGKKSAAAGVYASMLRKFESMHNVDSTSAEFESRYKKCKAG